MSRDKEIAKWLPHTGAAFVRAATIQDIHALSTIHHPISDRIPVMPSKRKVQMSSLYRESKVHSSLGESISHF